MKNMSFPIYRKMKGQKSVIIVTYSQPFVEVQFDKSSILDQWWICHFQFELSVIKITKIAHPIFLCRIQKQYRPTIKLPKQIHCGKNIENIYLKVLLKLLRSNKLTLAWIQKIGNFKVHCGFNGSPDLIRLILG